MQKIILFLVCIPSLFIAQIDNYSQHRIPCEKSVYLLNYHFVMKYNYPSPIVQNDVSDLYTLTNAINSVFAPTCIEFKICKIDTIYDYNYYNINDDKNTNEVLDIVNQNFNPHAINIYWVGDNKDQTFKGICDSQSAKPRIFIPYNSPILPLDQQFFQVQMLRYFGLPSTSSSTFSRELVNGSNGKIKADNIWDTPADPFGIPGLPTDVTYYPFQFAFYYTTKKDANGEYYNPMVYNLMNDAQFPYKCQELTRGQYQQLVINDRQCRRKRWEF